MSTLPTQVKGQISDMAFCIVDPVDKIAGLSKLFFAELAKKGNTLYNVMPDIVSRLSDSEVLEEHCTPCTPVSPISCGFPEHAPETEHFEF